MLIMMASSTGSIFSVTSLLCGEFTGHRWIPSTKAGDAELWCFLWSAPWINGWVNNREAGDLRRHRAHYDAIVMRNVIKHIDYSTNLIWVVGYDRPFSYINSSSEIFLFILMLWQNNQNQFHMWMCEPLAQLRRVDLYSTRERSGLRHDT